VIDEQKFPKRREGSRIGPGGIVEANAFSTSPPSGMSKLDEADRTLRRKVGRKRVSKFPPFTRSDIF
jgi:hypothetical protein